MNIKKMIAIISILVLLVGLFSGCDSKDSSDSNVDTTDVTNQDSAPNTTTGNSDSTDNNEVNNAPIEIRFSWWGDTLRHEVYNGICDAFEADYPYITVIREPGSWGDYWDRLATQTAGQSAPDVMGMHPQFVSDYAGRNALADLQGFMDDGIIRTDQIPQGILDSGIVAGKMIMVSQGVTFTNMIANQDLLDQVGVNVSKPDWTWDQFSETAKYFTDQARSAGLNNVYFTEDVSSYYNTFRYFVRQTGSDIYTDDGALGFDANVVEAWFSLWKELRDYGAMPDAATSTEAAALPLEQKLFTMSEVALAIFPVNQLHLYQAQMQDINLTPLRNPTGNGGERGEYVEGAHLAVSNYISDAHKEAAAKFVDFFVNEEASITQLKMEQGVPANEVLADLIKPLLNESQSKAIDYVAATMPVATGGVYAPIGATIVDTAFRDAAARVQFDVQTPLEAATQFIQEAIAGLEEAKR